LGYWKELKSQITVETSCNGLVLREAESGSLMIDFPKSSISKVDILSHMLVRIHAVTDAETLNKYALKFTHLENIQMFANAMNSVGIPLVHMEFTKHPSCETLLPDLNDNTTQEMLLNLLFSGSFDSFSQDVSALIDNFNAKF
jgi:hypothetical protein